MMLQQDTPDDYVIATNVARSVREFVEVSVHHKLLCKIIFLIIIFFFA